MSDPMSPALAGRADVRTILAIDPGSELSGWVVLNPATMRLRSFSKTPNAELLAMVRDLSPDVGAVVIENIEPRFGIHPGWETLDTARWTGRFQEAIAPMEVTLLKRSDVLRHLGIVTHGPNRTTADAGVHAALIDRFGGAGGKAAAVGVKASPGPLHGVTKDIWAALSVAVSWADGLR